MYMISRRLVLLLRMQDDNIYLRKFCETHSIFYITLKRLFLTRALSNEGIVNYRLSPTIIYTICAIKKWIDILRTQFST